MPRIRLLPFLVLVGTAACNPDLRDGDGDGVLAAEDCDDKDAAVGAEQAWFPDADGDGHHDIETWTVGCTAPAGSAATADDCDDADPAVNPSMTEVCNGADDDCNGSVDEADTGLDPSSLVEFYPDADADGYGTTAGSAKACSVPDGYTEVAGDCDDSDPDLNPETSWYADRDTDGWGDDDGVQQHCEQPQGHVQVAGDCDDDDPAVHPGADELCDGIDNDCDTLLDDDDPDLVLQNWALDSDGDGYGDPAQVVSACAPPSDHVALDLGEDCDDNEPTTNPGALEVCNDRVDNNCDGGSGDCGLPKGASSTDAADLALAGSDRWSNLGRAVRFLDFDGDGVDDLVVNSWSAAGASTSAGESYVFYGPVSGAESHDADLTLLGTIIRGYEGWTLADAGDTDGDGVNDLLVGSYLNDEGGQAYLVRGSAGRLTGDVTLDLADVVFDLSGHDVYAGRGVAGAGDLDGDGLAELMVGAPNDQEGGAYRGAVFVFGGAGLEGTLTSADASATWQGESDNSYLGETMGMAGADLDGDGLSDLLLGVTGANGYMGGVYVAYGDGPLDGSVHSTADADANIVGQEFIARFGDTVAPARDVDADGYPDFACSAPNAASYAGALAVFRGGATRFEGEVEAATTAWLWVTGANADDRLGYAADVGDLNGDGAVDLAVGVGGDDGGATDAGSVLVFAGPLAGGVLVPADASTHIDGRVDEGYLGWSGVAAGDQDGDGFDDLGTGAYGEGDDDGVLYLFLGGSM